MAERARHIVSLSGGKDSTALAIYLRDRIPDLEYVFCDTEKELPETYEYLAKVEAYLGRQIVRLKYDGRDFDHWLSIYGGYLPSPRARWCTRHLKLEPFEKYVGNDEVRNYVGIRADEDRQGFVSTKPNIRPVFPFREDGLTKADVMRILERSGLGLPAYYRWRSRSGCYFCFFQQKIEWVGLLESHPDRFEEARRYEKFSVDGARRYTWNSDESLDELATPDRIAQIRAEHLRRSAHALQTRANRSLMDVLTDDDAICFTDEEYDLDAACEICR